jgi:hypothetical protein
MKWYVTSNELKKVIHGEGSDDYSSALDACVKALKGFNRKLGNCFFADLPGWRLGADNMSKDGQIFDTQVVLNKAGYSLDTGAEPEGCS